MDPAGAAAWGAAQTVTLLVAVVAAAASVMGAVSSNRSARQAAQLNHQIAALDREAEQLAAAYREYVEALLAVGEKVTAGRAIGMGELLLAHWRATPALTHEVGQLNGRLSRAYTVPSEIDPARQVLKEAAARWQDDVPDPYPVTDVRQAFRDLQQAIAKERAGLVAQRDLTGWLPWRRQAKAKPKPKPKPTGVGG